MDNFAIDRNSLTISLAKNRLNFIRHTFVRR